VINLLIEFGWSNFEDNVLPECILAVHNLGTRALIVCILQHVRGHVHRLTKRSRSRGCVWPSAIHTVNFAPAPAPFSIRIPLKPALTRVETPVGLSATLFSPAKLSLGTPAASSRLHDLHGNCSRILEHDPTLGRHSYRLSTRNSWSEKPCLRTKT